MITIIIAHQTCYSHHSNKESRKLLILKSNYSYIQYDHINHQSKAYYLHGGNDLGKGHDSIEDKCHLLNQIF